MTINIPSLHKPRKITLVPAQVNMPYIKKFPKVHETLDVLDRYDPVEESDQFNKELSTIIASTSTILRDPALDVRELPHARNFFEWTSGSKFLGLKPFARQVDIGLQLNGDVCPRCSPEYYKEDINYKWHHSEFRKRYVLFNFGVCPECGMTREKAVRKGLMHDMTMHIGVAGQRSSKCLVGDTLICTPAGPKPISCLHVNDAVRLNEADVPMSATRQKREFTYRVETTFGLPIEGTRNHRLLTDAGYLHLETGPSLRPGNILIIPALPRIEPKFTRYDSRDRLEGNRAACAFLTKRSSLRLWDNSYAFKAEFFRIMLQHGLRYDASRLQFTAVDESSYVAMRMWLESHGIRTVPATDNIAGTDLAAFTFEVNIKAFLKHGPDVGLPSELRKHFWRLTSSSDTLPPVPGKCLSVVASLLRKVLTNHDRFKLIHRTNLPMVGVNPFKAKLQIGTTDLLKLGKGEERRELALYATFNICNSKGAITRKRVAETIQELWAWRNLAFTEKERSDYTTLIETLREMLTTRYAKITKVVQSKHRKLVYDITVPEYHWYAANAYHSHNSVLTGHNLGYLVHRAIHTGDPAGYYGLLPGTVLTVILTATAVAQAEKNLFRPLSTMMSRMPWFKTYAEWAQDKGSKLGIELFRIKDTYILYRASGIDIRIVAPDKRRSRGYNGLGIAIDELGWFDNDDAKVMVSGGEMWTALTNALLTVQSAAYGLRQIGEIDVVFPMAHAVSSPFDYSDPIMTLRKQHMSDPAVLTYKIPTWQFNPTITLEQCQRLNPSNWKRDFGCEPSTASGTFLTKSDALEAVFTDRRNAVKVQQETFTSGNGAKFTIGKLKFRWTPSSDDMVCGIALDAGWKNNSYAFCVFHFEESNPDDEDDDNSDDDENIKNDDVNNATAVEEDEDIDDDDDYEDDDPDETLDNYRVVIDAIGEVQPSETAPIHFTQMVKHVLYPLIEKFNVRVILSDRWQSLQTQQDLEDDLNIMAVNITPKIADFQSFREAIYDQGLYLPKLEIDTRDIMEMPSPSTFRGYPVSHFFKQCLSVKEALKTVEKGAVFSDDLFRTVVLAHMGLRDEEVRDLLISDMEPAPEGPVSIVAHADPKFTKEQERTPASAVVWKTPGQRNLVSNPNANKDDSDDDAFDKPKQPAPVSTVITSR